MIIQNTQNGIWKIIKKMQRLSQAVAFKTIYKIFNNYNDL